jgi:hypothetical protein
MALAGKQASRPSLATRLQRTTTRSAGGDSCFLAKEQSWRTAWRARSLLSRTRSSGPAMPAPRRSSNSAMGTGTREVERATLADNEPARCGRVAKHHSPPPVTGPSTAEVRPAWFTSGGASFITLAAPRDGTPEKARKLRPSSAARSGRLGSKSLLGRRINRLTPGSHPRGRPFESRLAASTDGPAKAGAGQAGVPSRVRWFGEQWIEAPGGGM